MTGRAGDSQAVPVTSGHRPTAKWLTSPGKRAPATAPGVATGTEPPQIGALPVAQI